MRLQKKPFTEILRTDTALALLFQAHTGRVRYTIELAREFTGPWSAPLEFWAPEGYTDPSASRTAFHEIRQQHGDALVIIRPSSFTPGGVALSDTGMFYMRVSQYAPSIWGTSGGATGGLTWQDLNQTFDGITGMLVVENGINAGEYPIVAAVGNVITVSPLTPFAGLSANNCYSCGAVENYTAVGGTEQGIFVMASYGFWRSRNPTLVFEGQAPVAADFTGSVPVWLPRSCKLLKVLDYGGGAGLWISVDDEGPEFEIPDTTELSIVEASTHVLCLRGTVPYGGGPYGTRFRVIAVF